MMPEHITRTRTALPLIAAALIALAHSAAPASWRADADSLREAAESAFEARDFADAAELFGRTMAVIEREAGAEPLPYFATMAARCRFMRGRSLELDERWDEAAASYSACLSELPDISDAVRIRLAECHRRRGDIDGAIVLLRAVLDDGERTSLDHRALEELAACHSEAGDHDMAVQWYRMLLGEATGYDEKARAHYRIGLAQEQRGDEDAAKESYAIVVNDFPRSRYAADALKQARRLSRAFTDRYHQGLVHYNGGDFKEAAEFFTYYVRHDREREYEFEASYFLGRAHQRMGNFKTAARRYEDALSLGVEGEYFGLTWQKLAYCYRAHGDLDMSLATYERALASYPDRDWSADVLWDKARLLEEKRRWAEAETDYRRLARDYEASDRAPDALFRAGLCLFKRGLYDDAEQAFAELYMSGEGGGSRALFWAGRCLELLGRVEEAEEVYRESVGLDRDSFHGRRALDRLRSLGLARPPEPHAVSPVWFAGGYMDLSAGEVQEFAAWLAEWYDGSYFPAARYSIVQELREHPLFRRGDTFMAVHMRDEALREFRALESAVGGDPRMLDVLATHYVSVGLHKRSIAVSERVAAMSPASTLSDLPVYLKKRICPRHFSALVESECAERGVDPNLLYSLMRQESLFEPGAMSWVGARGLTQIMPGTGRWIARKLGDRGFRTARLLDPAVNVRYGTYYLSVQMCDFEGDIERALAAYNGGPENTERWWDYGGGAGVDVFVEDIGYSETSDYVRRVYRYYRLYEEIYGSD